MSVAEHCSILVRSLLQSGFHFIILDVGPPTEPVFHFFPEKSGGIGAIHRIITHVGVCVPTLWIYRFGTGIPWVGRHEASVLRRIVSRAKVIEPGFGVAFFAGELVVLGARVRVSAFA